jgi:signal transduction histidine kinase
MWVFLKSLSDNSTFSPHGLCLLWEPGIIWLHVLSDGIIAVAYFSIPFALTYFVSKRRDVEFGWVFWAFAVFIMACGLTHVFSIVTLWVPVYELEGLVKAFTAAASIATAMMLWPLLPKLLALPSPAQLRDANTALKNEMVQRQEVEEMLRQAQRMDALGQLTGGVAHDFNNLLTVIMGNLEIAQRRLDSWSQGAEINIRRLVENSMAGAKRAATLTQRLLAFARRQPLKPESANVNQLLTGVSEFFRRTLGENIDFEIVSGVSLWNVEVDRSQMEAAILNLVVNARDAMADGGKLTIETGNAFIDEDYSKRHAEVQPGQYVQISVTDSGVGMTPDVMAHAFEPFFTTKEVGQGTGLGLSQVYGFVKQSGGHVKIYSEPNEGTTVKIYIPRLFDQAVAVTVPERDVVGSDGGEVILVVEDDPDVRAYILETFSELNYRVLEAADGAAALAFIERTGRNIGLLLTDVVLPGINGRVLASEVRKKIPNVRILYMTGYSRNAIVHQGRLDIGVELIQKPLTQRTLAIKIRELLDGLKANEN